LQMLGCFFADGFPIECHRVHSVKCLVVEIYFTGVPWIHLRWARF